VHFKFIESIIYCYNQIPATALINTLPDNNNKDNNNEVSIETNEVQSTTALSVLYNSEYINGK